MIPSTQNHINETSIKSSLTPNRDSQPLSLERLNQALKDWKKDRRVTGNKDQASKKIREGFQKKITDLNLSNLQLSALPTIIGHFTQLQKLNLAGNQLKWIPAEIGQLNQLESLDLKDNPSLRKLPVSLGELSQLSFIDVEGTQISPEVRDSILAHCQAKKKEQDSFIAL
jgi:Leucine-rich repeat (LRR) protein